MYASTSARRASASIRRAPSRTISSITDDAADRAAPEPSRSAESETTVSIGSYLPDQRCRAGLAWNLSSVTREGTPHPKPIHRFQALLLLRRSALACITMMTPLTVAALRADRHVHVISGGGARMSICEWHPCTQCDR